MGKIYISHDDLGEKISNMVDAQFSKIKYVDSFNRLTEDEVSQLFDNAFSVFESFPKSTSAGVYSAYRTSNMTDGKDAKEPSEMFSKIIKESIADCLKDEDSSNENASQQDAKSHRSPDMLKIAQKKQIKTKFIVGQQYALRSKSKDGSRSVEKTFELKKFIYTINDLPVNVVVMKQLSGEQSMIFTLNRHDCMLYHIKYEPGLQVWPMSMKWVKVKQKETNNK